MKYHPDDQAEIDRLHAEFIGPGEPNNEQVMAFQYASYALGLKRGQAHEVALQQSLTETDQRIDETQQLLKSLRDQLDRQSVLAAVRLQDLDEICKEIARAELAFRCALPFVQARCEESDYGDASARTALDLINRMLKVFETSKPAEGCSQLTKDSPEVGS